MPRIVIYDRRALVTLTNDDLITYILASSRKCGLYHWRASFVYIVYVYIVYVYIVYVLFTLTMYIIRTLSISLKRLATKSGRINVEVIFIPHQQESW